MIGPFFFVYNRLIYNAIPLEEGRKQADKLDNSYGHDKLWSDYFLLGDYIHYPRGRVIWDCTNNHSIIYIDRCINRQEVIDNIKAAFDITDYVVEFDDHYRCRNCISYLCND